MRLTSKFDVRLSVYSTLAVACLSFGMVSCTSDDDGADLEAEEPVESQDEAAAPATEAEAGGAAPTAPEDAGPQAPEAPAPDMTAPAPAQEAAPAQVPSMNASRRVMYVKSNGVKMYDAASTSAKVVKTLKKGDHILFNISGEWGRTDDGKFVSMKDLSEKGIGRGKKAKGHWSNPSGSGK